MQHSEVPRLPQPRDCRGEDKLVGANVRKRRRELGMKQGDLARAVGITHQMVQKYEAGQSRLAVARLIDIAQALGVTPGYLIDPIFVPKPPPMPEPASVRAWELLQCFEQLDVDAKDNVLSIVRRMAQPKAA